MIRHALQEFMEAQRALGLSDAPRCTYTPPGVSPLILHHRSCLYLLVNPLTHPSELAAGFTWPALATWAFVARWPLYMDLLCCMGLASCSSVQQDGNSYSAYSRVMGVLFQPKCFDLSAYAAMCRQNGGYQNPPDWQTSLITTASAPSCPCTAAKLNVVPTRN